nr:MAG TPA: hypothetical protein [Caudoviricetes sp.]
MALAIGPNRHLTVRGRRFVPADGLARYSAAVSDRGSLTSHDAALFWRSFDVSRAVALIFSHRPRESDGEASALAFVGLGVCLIFPPREGLGCELNSGYFRLGAFLAYRSDSEALATAPP